MFGAVVASSTSALPEVEEGGEVAGYRSRNNDVREEGEEEASEEKMEERVDDDVVRSRQINRDSQEGREAVCVRERALCAPHVITTTSSLAVTLKLVAVR